MEVMHTNQAKSPHSSCFHPAGVDSYLACPPGGPRTPAWPPPSPRCHSTPAACPGGLCGSGGRGLWSDQEGLRCSSSLSPPPWRKSVVFISPGLFGIFRVTHHSTDELVVYGRLHEQTSGSDAVLAFVEIHGAHALRRTTRKHDSFPHFQLNVGGRTKSGRCLTMRTALSMSQSAKMMSGDFPPSSRETFLRLLRAQL